MSQKILNSIMTRYPSAPEKPAGFGVSESSNLKAFDITDGEQLVLRYIQDGYTFPSGDVAKYAAYYTRGANLLKPHILNVTNQKAIADLLGTDDEEKIVGVELSQPVTARLVPQRNPQTNQMVDSILVAEPDEQFPDLDDGDKLAAV